MSAGDPDWQIMTKLALVILLVAIAAPAFAQTTVTIAVFPTTATDPNVAAPVAAPVSYPMAGALCGQTKVTPQNNPTNPTTAAFDDPADATKDCVIDARVQLAALANGSYKAAAKFDSDSYSATFSNPFARVRVAGLRIR